MQCHFILQKQTWLLSFRVTRFQTVRPKRDVQKEKCTALREHLLLPYIKLLKSLTLSKALHIYIYINIIINIYTYIGKLALRWYQKFNSTASSSDLLSVTDYGGSGLSIKTSAHAGLKLASKQDREIPSQVLLIAGGHFQQVMMLCKPFWSGLPPRNESDWVSGTTQDYCILHPLSFPIQPIT